MAVQDQAFIRRQRARPRDAMTTPKGLALEGVRGLVRRARYAARAGRRALRRCAAGHPATRRGRFVRGAASAPDGEVIEKGPEDLPCQ